MRVSFLAFKAALLLATAAFPVVGQQNNGYLKTAVDPGRAGVFIDGKYVGPARNFGFARKYALPAGEHEIKLAEPRYEEFVTKITVEPGKTTKLSQNMKALQLAQPPFGRLRTISKDKFAAVYVNGRYMGHVDEFSNPMQGLQLNPGEYTVKLVPLNAANGKEEKVRIETDKVTAVRFE
jgi:hypothetical protein